MDHPPNVSVLVIVLITLLIGALVLAVGANLRTTEKRLLYRPRRLYTSGDADFRRALGILLGPPLVAGNRISSLVNGEQIYAAMLNAIRTAQTNITFETFVFRDGVGATFVEALVGRRAARRAGTHAARLAGFAHHGPAPAAGGARRRLRAAPVSPALLVPPRPAQQSHAPQAAW